MKPLCIGITGAEGMIGWHFRTFLEGQPEVQVKCANRATFADDSALRAFVEGTDAIVHLAGMNRGDDREIEETNVRLARMLADACARTGNTPHIVFSSSTHIYRETPYGRSKLECARVFQEWEKASGGRFTNLVLPHVFGECGRPFYNSVVHTFCHQVAQGESPEIQQDGDLELLHAQDVSSRVLEIIRSETGGEVREQGVPMRVSELLDRVQHLSVQYQQHILPHLEDPLDLRLFNTYRSYLYPEHYPVELKLHKDDRGELFEAVKGHNGGQTFMSTTRPGITRGNHYHLNKVERFLVVRGEGLIRIRKMFDTQVREFKVCGDNPQYIDMPTLHTHNITNIGEGDLLTLFWAHEIFSPEHPDTIRANV